MFCTMYPGTTYKTHGTTLEKLLEYFEGEKLYSDFNFMNDPSGQELIEIGLSDKIKKVIVDSLDKGIHASLGLITPSTPMAAFPSAVVTTSPSPSPSKTPIQV